MDITLISAKAKATKTRNELGLGINDGVNIFELLKNIENINIIRTPIKGDISGFFIRKGDMGLILVNNRRSLGHQIFTAAHEYFHLKYDKALTGKLCLIKNYYDSNANEREANYFASHFLMTDDSLSSEIGKRLNGENRNLIINDIIYLENRFVISHSAMLFRLKEIGAIKKEDKFTPKKGITKTAIELGYDAKLYRTTDNEGTIIYSNYAELASELYEAGKISYGKYEDLLIEGGYEKILFGDDASDETNTQGEFQE